MKLLSLSLSYQHSPLPLLTITQNLSPDMPECVPEMVDDTKLRELDRLLGKLKPKEPEVKKEEEVEEVEQKEANDKEEVKQEEEEEEAMEEEEAEDGKQNATKEDGEKVKEEEKVDGEKKEEEQEQEEVKEKEKKGPEVERKWCLEFRKFLSPSVTLGR